MKWTQKEGNCVLETAKKGKHVLEIAARTLIYDRSPYFDVYIDDEKLSIARLKTDWHTYQFPITTNNKTVSVKLRINKLLIDETKCYRDNTVLTVMGRRITIIGDKI